MFDTLADRVFRDNRERRYIFTHYRVDLDGGIYSYKRGKYLRHLGINHPPYYPTVTLQCGGYERRFLVHRLVAHLYCVNKRKLSEVNHRDRNRNNCHYTNLEWCTRSENVKHFHETPIK